MTLSEQEYLDLKARVAELQRKAVILLELQMSALALIDQTWNDALDWAAENATAEMDWELDICTVDKKSILAGKKRIRT